MIWLNRTIEPIFNVDRDFLLEYKKECDRYLAGIKHILTKQLVDYTVYCDLNGLYRSFGHLISELLHETIEERKVYDQLKKDIEVETNAFLQGLKGTLPEDIIDQVIQQVNLFTTQLKKFYYVLETVCYVGG